MNITTLQIEFLELQKESFKNQIKDCEKLIERNQNSNDSSIIQLVNEISFTKLEIENEIKLIDLEIEKLSNENEEINLPYSECKINHPKKLRK